MKDTKIVENLFKIACINQELLLRSDFEREFLRIIKIGEIGPQFIQMVNSTYLLNSDFEETDFSIKCF